MSFSIKNSNTPVKKYDPKTEQNILKKESSLFQYFYSDENNQGPKITPQVACRN